MKNAAKNAILQVLLLTIHVYGIAAFRKSYNNNINEEVHNYDFSETEIIKYKIWPRGKVPYYIDNESYDKGYRDKLRLFLQYVNGLSGMEFFGLYEPPSAKNSRWVHFINKQVLLTTGGYTTHYFTSQGVQTVALGYESLSNGDLFELVLAIAGIPPQNNAPNRDDFIEIMHENILDDKKHLFAKVDQKDWLFNDLGYDFSSAGHFGFHKYSKNGIATILPRNGISNTEEFGKGFSHMDVSKLQMLYDRIANKDPKPAKAICERIFKPGPKFHSVSVEKEDEIKMKTQN